jgi:hypothetical protein
MINLPVTQKLAAQIRARAKAEGVSVSTYLTRKLRNGEQKSSTIKRRSSRVMRRPSITEQANKVCELVDTSLDSALAKMQATVWEREKW